MTNVTDIKHELEKLGLSQNQADIYILLLRQGHLRISEIVSSLHLPRSSVYENLKGLFELGLAEEVVENSFKIIKAYPIGVLKHHLDEQVQGLQQQSLKAEQLEKKLSALSALSPALPVTVRYYKDKAGARQLFWNSLKAQAPVYVYSEWGRGRYVGIDFYKNFVDESFARHIQEKVITNSSDRVLDSIRQHAGTPVSRTNLETIRCISESAIQFKGESLMYDNVYAHIFLKDETISGFEIESQQFVDTQRAIFETLWQSAQPVITLL